MTRHRVALLAGLMVFTLLGVWSPVGAQQILLRHKFFPPRDLVYDFWASGTATVSGSTLPIPTQQQNPAGWQVLQQTVNGRLVARIESVDGDGNGTVTLKLGRLGMEMSAMECSIHLEFDPAQGIVEADDQAIISTELQQVLRWVEAHKLTISPRGKVLAASAPGPVTIQPSWGGPLLLMMRSEDWQKLLEATPAWLPRQPVQVGDRWGMKMAIPIPGRFAAQHADVSVHYTLEDIGYIEDNQIARIGLESGISQADIFVPAGRWGNWRGGSAVPNLRLALDEKLSGQLYFNLDSGQLYSARGDVTMTVQLQSAQAQQQSKSSQQPAAPAFQTEFKLHFEVFPSKT